MPWTSVFIFSTLSSVAHAITSAGASTSVGTAALTGTPSADNLFGFMFFVEFGMRVVVGHKRSSRR